MKTTLLFAVDTNTNETIISESLKGSNQVNFIERIHRDDNELLFEVVSSMSKYTRSPKFDVALFKALDKVCVSIYTKHGESR